MFKELYIKRVGYYYDFFSDIKFCKLRFTYSINHKIFKGTTGELIDADSKSCFKIFQKLKFIDFNDYLELEINSSKIGIYEAIQPYPHWYINISNLKYCIYRNNEARFSIYKNEMQIGGIIKDKLDFFNKSNYHIKTDEPESIEIQLALFLAINFSKSNEDATLTFEINSSYYKDADLAWFKCHFESIKI